jgi:hypothetical protein
MGIIFRATRRRPGDEKNGEKERGVSGVRVTGVSVGITVVRGGEVRKGCCDVELVLVELAGGHRWWICTRKSVSR